MTKSDIAGFINYADFEKKLAKLEITVNFEVKIILKKIKTI